VDGRRQWLAEQEPFARAWKRFPPRVQTSARSAKRWLRLRRPGILRTVYRWNRQWHGVDLEPIDRFYEAFYDSGAVVLSGAGGLTDHARSWAGRVLDILEIGIRRGLPTAVFGHGLGPLTDPDLVKRARAVLPQISLLALREGLFGPALADALGVDPSRVFVTGDDAIELALDAAPKVPGEALGVNLRLSPSSGIGVGAVGAIRQSLAGFVRFRRPPLLAAPIAFNERMDGPESARVYADDQSIRLLLEGIAEVDPPSESLDTPEALIRQLGRTRVLVTAAYHAAVFALSQGVPAVCLGASPYFLQKFDGLAHQFGPGCRVVRVGGDDFERSFTNALTELWDDAESHRGPLRAAARRQVDAGYEAYWAFQRLVEKRS
jgi:colanic acid/amylovoran biosynthesis protein